MKKILMKKTATVGLMVLLLSVAFSPSINSQVEIKVSQFHENKIMEQDLLVQRNIIIPPVFDGRLEDVYFTHGKRIYYGNVMFQNASANLYVIDNTTIDATYVWIAWVLNPYFIDNTYGNGTVPQYKNINGNPCGHNFNDLNNSDRQAIKLYNNSGLVFHAFMDLIHYVGNTTNSGYGIPIWGDGESMVYYGNSDLVQYTTSTSFNINYYYNTTPYNVLTDSPTLGDQNYTLYQGYEEWEHKIIYELKINRSLFGEDTIDISATEFVDLHASPNRIGPHTIPLNPIYGSLGDYVWEDLNKDGIQNTNETGLVNITVQLYYFYKVSNITFIQKTTTNSSGYYKFINLGPGDYYLKFIKPIGYRFTLPDQTDDTYDSDANVITGETTTITLSPGENDYTWDAGLYLEEYTLNITIDGQGIVEKYPNPPYTHGTIVQLTAIPNTGWSFSHWSGDASGTSPVTTVTMTGNKSVTAHFTQNIYTLTIQVDPAAGGSVVADPAPPYYYGTVVTLTATENPGYSFSHWSGNLTGNQNPETINMTDNKTVTAHFTSTIDTNPPLVKIVKPRNAIYIINKEILPINTIPIIFYMLTIEVNATDNESGVDRVEFIINGLLLGTDTSEPYSYDWRTLRSGKHTIQVKAYDKAGNSATSPELLVFKWRLHPILIFPLLTLAVLLTGRP